MPFLLAEILNFQGSTHHIGVGSFSTLEEYPDGIEDPIIHVTFENQKRGYYYRIRGAFSAGDDDWYEGFGPTTDGIWIE